MDVDEIYGLLVSILSLTGHLRLLECLSRAVGVDANPLCLKRCIQRQKQVIDLPIGASIEWWNRDITKVSADDLLQTAKFPGRLVVYAYLGPRVMSQIMQLLIDCIARGAVVVTYEHHLSHPLIDKTVGCVAMYGGSLRCYTARPSSEVPPRRASVAKPFWESEADRSLDRRQPAAIRSK